MPKKKKPAEVVSFRTPTRSLGHVQAKHISHFNKAVDEIVAHTELKLHILHNDVWYNLYAIEAKEMLAYRTYRNKVYRETGQLPDIDW